MWKDFFQERKMKKNDADCIRFVWVFCSAAYAHFLITHTHDTIGVFFQTYIVAIEWAIFSEKKQMAFVLHLTLELN